MNKTFLVIGTFIYISTSAAAVITLPAQLTVGNQIVDFESKPLGVTLNPLTIGEVTFSATTPLAIDTVSSFGANGTFVQDHVLRSNGSNSLGSAGYVDIRIDFSTKVVEVGLGWFDPNFTGNELRAYNSSNVLLEAAPIPTGPAGGSFAAFRGFQRPQGDISYVIAHVSAANDVFAIDNVSFQTVPEPQAFVLAAAGLVALRVRRTLAKG